MDKSNLCIEDIVYKPSHFFRRTVHTKSIQVMGLDTEAYTSGKCFMIATSENDVFTYDEYPACLFNRKYRGANFVAFNLKYDTGALVQILSRSELKDLQTTGKAVHEDYTFKVISNKFLSIRKGKNTIHIYDMLNFYNMSLDAAAKKYLGKSKVDIETKEFTKAYVRKNWNKIAEYCKEDAVLVRDLAILLIKKFEAFGVYPKKLYSVAYVSFQYFTSKCNYITVKRFWDDCPELLDYAIKSYNGGKFEVTEKGTGYFYEYDIVSAYPYEIANLIDISDARVEKSKKYCKDAIYGFVRVAVNIPFEVYSPVAWRRNMVNIYPVGSYERVITKNEYEYLLRQGVDVTIRDAWWLIKQGTVKPYHHEVLKLMEWKDKFKREGKKMDYHTVKIFLNSFYGKMVQLIAYQGKWKASTSWNPIYGSVITANCRIRISELQQKYPEVIAVHTDSVISTKPLPFGKQGNLGDIIYELEGDGLILGSGIYQIGKKNKFRGFESSVPIIELLPKRGKKLNVSRRRPFSWREVAYRGLPHDMINKFEELERALSLNFDTKRIWLDDYEDYSEVLKRNVDSVPWPAGI